MNYSRAPRECVAIAIREIKDLMSHSSVCQDCAVQVVALRHGADADRLSVLYTDHLLGRLRLIQGGRHD